MGRLLLEGIAIAGVAAFVARYVGGAFNFPDSTPGQIAEVTVRRAETWAAVGALICLWLAYRTGRGAELVRAGVAGLAGGALAGLLGGLAWALPFYLNDPNLSGATANEIQVGSVALTGAILGAILGGQWRPRAVVTGLGAGLVAGTMVQLLLNTFGLENDSPFEAAFCFGLTAIAIVGLTLAVLASPQRAARSHGSGPGHKTRSALGQPR